MAQSGDTPRMDEDPPFWNEGTPAEAIQLALTQEKLFLVWISSPESEDSAWAAIWTDAAIKSLLVEHAISLKLDQGTTDAAMFLQVVSMAPTSIGVWLVFAGELLDSFIEPPSPQDFLQRTQSAVSKSSDLKSSSSQPASSPGPSQSDNIKAQLATRRAKLEAAKIAHGKFAIKAINHETNKKKRHGEQRPCDKPRQRIQNVKNILAKQQKKGLNKEPNERKSSKKSKMINLSVRKPGIAQNRPPAFLVQRRSYMRGLLWYRFDYLIQESFEGNSKPERH